MYDQLRHDIVGYYQHAVERHRVSFQDQPISPHAAKEPGLYLPSFNKLKGFHSAPLTMLHKVKNWFNLDLEALLEATVPFSFASSYKNPYKILCLWLDCGAIPNKTGTNNLAVEILTAMTSEFGGINTNCGSAMRCIAFFNFSVTFHQIVNFCKNVRDVTLILNQDKSPRQYKEIAGLYKQVGLIGDLSAQHLISLLAGLGLLRHGINYVTQATVCKGTKTFAKLKEFYTLPDASIDQAYIHIAKTLNINTALLEQIICEFFRDCDPTLGFCPHVYTEKVLQRIQSPFLLRPDLRFHGQWLFDVEDGKIVYEERGKNSKTVVLFRVPCSRLIDPYVLSQISNLSMEIKTSKMSSFCPKNSHPKRKPCNGKRFSYDDKQETTNTTADLAVSFHLSKRTKLEMANNHRLIQSSLGFSQLDLLGASEADHNDTGINCVQTIFDSLDGPSPSCKKSRKQFKHDRSQQKKVVKGLL